MTDATVLAVVVPIFGAMLSLIAGLWFDRSGWTIAALTCVVELATAVAILVTVVQEGAQRYELAGFSPPQGIELVVDGLSAPVIVLIAAVSLAVVIYARHAGPRGNAFYTVYLLLVGGLAGVTLTGDIFNMYVFLEITGLAAYALVASGDSASSAVAGLKYLILGTIGASLFLLGAGYAYIATGTLNMADLSEKLAVAGDYSGYDSKLVLGAFGLIVTGLLVKVALFPVHTWQPKAYSNAPDSVSVYISALVSTVAAYAVARVIFTVFTPDFFAANPAAQTVLLYAAAVSIIAGSVLAVLQRDFKRMLAYSSVSQFGMVIAGFGLLSQSAAVGGVIHLIGHAVLKGGLFGAVGVVALQTGARSIDEYAGLAGRAPLSAALVAILGLSLVGVPPSVGFVGKFYIAVGAVEAGEWPIAAVIFVSTVLTLAYVARIIERMYFRQPSPESATDSAVAVGGGESISADGGEDVSADGGAERSDAGSRGLPGDGDGVSPEMIAVVVAAAIAAVVLGFTGSAIESFLDPVLTEVFN